MFGSIEDIVLDCHVTGRVIGRARLLVDSQLKDQTVSSSRQWTFFDDNIQLTIQRNAEDSQWHLRPELNIQGQVGNPVRVPCTLSSGLVNLLCSFRQFATAMHVYGDGRILVTKYL